MEVLYTVLIIPAIGITWHIISKRFSIVTKDDKMDQIIGIVKYSKKSHKKSA